jgi:hypothetical protein
MDKRRSLLNNKGSRREPAGEWLTGQKKDGLPQIKNPARKTTHGRMIIGGGIGRQPRVSIFRRIATQLPGFHQREEFRFPIRVPKIGKLILPLQIGKVTVKVFNRSMK